MTEQPEKILSYPTPPRERPTPLWKHFVFVPLMFWTACVGVGMVLAVLLAGGYWLWTMLTRSP